MILPTAFKTKVVERGGGGKEKAEAEVVAQVSLRDNYDHKELSSEIIMSEKKYLQSAKKYSSSIKCF